MPSGSGAAPGEIVLRVGDYAVSRAQLDASFARIGEDTLQSADEARATHVEALIERYLILQHAKNQDWFDTGQTGTDLQLTIEDQTLSQRIRDIELAVPDPTREELRVQYDRSVVLYDVSHILVPTEEEARAALARLDAGEAFADLAGELSVDTKSRRKGGRLTPFVWSAAKSSFMKLFSRMEPGEIAGPVQSEVGFHVFRLNGMIPRTRPSFAEARQDLARSVTMQRLRERQEEFHASLEHRFVFERHLDVAMELAAVYASELNHAEEQNPGADHEEIAIAAIDRVVIPEALLPEKLTTSELGNYTVEQHWEYSRGMPVIVFADKRNPHMILNDARADFIQKALPVVARDRGLRDDPLVREAIDAKMEEIALGLLARTLGGEAQIFSPGEERAYYEENREQFVRPPRVRVSRAVYVAAEPARELEASLHGKGGDNPAALRARHSSEGLLASYEKQSSWMTATDDPWLLGLTEAMNVGDVLVTRDSSDNWVVLSLLARDAGGAIPFEDARDDVHRALMALRTQAAKAQLIEKLRASIVIWTAD